MSVNGETVVRILPAAALSAAAWALAWVETGSIAGADWYPYALFACLLLAVVLVAGNALRPTRLELAALAALVLLAGWDAISASWSAVPALARDEALLTLLYALVLLTPIVTLASQAQRLLACAAVAAVSSLLAVGAAAELRFGANQLDHFYSGRLSFPISYPNALAAALLIGFWPAVVLASRRELNPLARALALGGAAAITAGWLQAQSKGGVAATAFAAVVLFAVSPARLRLLPPALIAAGLTAIAYRPLTAPFRAMTAGDVRHAGATALIVAVIGLVAGLVYALVDRRVTLGARATKVAGAGTAAAVVAVLAVGVALFFGRVYHAGWFGEQWRAFKGDAPSQQASSHLLQLGSYRYDIWRVALDEWTSHPLAGIGSRGFGAAYLQHRRSPDVPARAHSVGLDALSETGVVGFVLLVLGLGLPLVVLVPRVRGRDPAATAAFGGAAYWLAHASVDWIWTVPACGIPFFLLLGTGLAGGERSFLPRRAAWAGAAVLVVVALVAFVPPWLSARATARGDFAAARRLDPLSVAPYLAEAGQAATPADAVRALEAAVRKEPRVVELRYDLALAYARERRFGRARAELLVARRLDPREPRIADALKRLPRRSIGSS
jgi:O-antigen ligase